MTTNIPKNWRITHVIFDFGGTLVDTIKFYPLIVRDVANKLGKQLPKDFEENIPRLCDVNDLKIALEVLLDIKLDVTALVYESVAQLRPQIELKPGVERLVAHLYKHGIPMAIATAGKLSHFKFLTANLGYLLNYMSHVVCAADDDEVAANKPSPDAYLVCAKRFSRPPADMRSVLVIEDNVDCVRGAVEAGMTTLLVPSEICPQLDSDNDCALILKSLEYIRPELFGLPPF